MNLQYDYAIPEWPYAWGGPVGTGAIKTEPEDFNVLEDLPFQPEGCGEHVFLQIEKSGENTDYVARLLARFAGVRQRDIGFAGLKDRHAKTVQWFSVWLPGRDDPDWAACETETVKILQAVRHARKLKRGAVAQNRFRILIRNWQGGWEAANQRLQLIERQGFPNYFAEQRFGRTGDNVEEAVSVLGKKRLKRQQQSIYLSAIRAFLFNQVLAERIRQKNWNRPVDGDVCMFDQSRSHFKIDKVQADIEQRMSIGEIHPTGMMWGKNEAHQFDGAERTVVERYPELTELLLKFDLEMNRRALRVIPNCLEWEFSCSNGLLLQFSLPAGSYATALLREVVIADRVLAEP